MEKKIIEEMRKLRQMRNSACIQIEGIIELVKKQEDKVDKMLPEGQTIK